jgi:hypothetical protein
MISLDFQYSGEGNSQDRLGLVLCSSRRVPSLRTNAPRLSPVDCVVMSNSELFYFEQNIILNKSEEMTPPEI